MRYFELIGRRLPFRAVEFYTLPWGTPCVMGITVDDKGVTWARLEDIISIDGREDW